MSKITHIDLFSGIGGLALATEMVYGQGGVEHIFCDNEPFAQTILKKHWPKAQIVSDIRQFTINPNGHEHRAVAKKIYAKKKIQRVGREALGTRQFIGADILTGGFPCQPFSAAGKRRGTEDDRHLWPEMLRVIREFHPRWIIGENVGGLVTWDGGVVLEQIHLDLESEGYSVQAFIIPAVALNAPHRRDRVWIVGHANSDRRAGKYAQINAAKKGKQALNNTSGRHKPSQRNNTNTAEQRLQRQRNETHKPRSKSNDQFSYGRNRGRPLNAEWKRNWVEVAARLCTLDDGLPGGLARPKGWRNAALKGAGNAIVPQVAAEIIAAIKAIDS